MTTENLRMRADRAFLSCRFSMEEALGGKNTPATVGDAEKLRQVCTEAIGSLRSYVSDCVRTEEALRKDYLSGEGDSDELAHTLTDYADTRAHIDKLITSVTKAKAQANEAVLAFRSYIPTDTGAPAVIRDESRVERMLAGLEDLHQSGSLTDEEFERAKNRVLSSHSMS